MNMPLPTTEPPCNNVRRWIQNACAFFCLLPWWTALPLSADQGEPDRNIPLDEKDWEDLSNHQVNPFGELALQINPDRWRHAETDHFIIHYRRVTEARRVAREIEYYLWYVARALEAEPEDYARKSHVYVFEDDSEWRRFLAEVGIPQWSAAFAMGDELFLNVRRRSGSQRFDSQLLAHETTHAVIARLYPRARWPLWLNEGFSEYMGSAAVAARQRQSLGRHQRDLRYASLSLDEMAAMDDYPEDPLDVTRLYQSAEAFVRYLIDEHGLDLFRQFILEVIQEGEPEEVLLTVYSEQYATMDDFNRRFERNR